MTLNPSDQDLDIARELTQDRLPNRRMKRIASALAIERTAALAKGREEALASLREPSDELVDAIARYCFENSVFRKLPSAAEGWDHAPPQLRMPNLKYARLAIVAIIRALSPSSPGEPPPIREATEGELRAQRESWARGEMAIGTDRDEAEYRAQRSPGEPAGSGWQTIATAPKDGTTIFGCDAKMACRGMVHFNSDGKWEMVNGLTNFPNGKFFSPTHWHPLLPAPPHEPTGETE